MKYLVERREIARRFRLLDTSTELTMLINRLEEMRLTADQRKILGRLYDSGSASIVSIGMAYGWNTGETARRMRTLKRRGLVKATVVVAGADYGFALTRAGQKVATGITCD